MGRLVRQGWTYSLTQQCQQREINYELNKQTILEHKEDFSEFCWVFEQQWDGRCILKEVTKLR